MEFCCDTSALWRDSWPRASRESVVARAAAAAAALFAALQSFRDSLMTFLLSLSQASMRRISASMSEARSSCFVERIVGGDIVKG